MRLGRMICNRLAMLVVVMLGVSISTFLISRVIPGDPAALLAGPRATPKLLAELRADIGLDASLFEQYSRYMGDLLQGDLGKSIMTRRPVLSELLGFMPATLELMLCALVLSLAVGIPLGVVCAVYRNRWPDLLGRGWALLGISAPSFWLALLAILLFYGLLGWLPGSGRLDLGVEPPPGVTGMYLIDGALAGDGLVLRSAFNHLLLPASVLALTSIGLVVRMIRGSMIEVLAEDHIRTARAFGLPSWRILSRYALPNALMPLVTVIGLELASLLFGSVIVESVFAWPGVGGYVLAAILGLDFPVIMGFTVLASLAYVLSNLFVDLAYLMLDPRLRTA